MKLKVFENVSVLKNINIKSHIERAFRQSTNIATQVSRQVANQKKMTTNNRGKAPWTAKGVRKGLTSMIGYRVNSSSDQVTMSFVPGGSTVEDDQKLFAQNYGLRAARPDEIARANQNRMQVLPGRPNVTTGLSFGRHN